MPNLPNKAVMRFQSITKKIRREGMQVVFRPKSTSKTQNSMFLAGEASHRPKNHILGNEFGRRICLYPFLLCQIFKKLQFVEKSWNKNDALFFWKKSHQQKCLGVEKWNVGNRLKRVLAKFGADRSYVRGVNGRSKFESRPREAESRPREVEPLLSAHLL